MARRSCGSERERGVVITGTGRVAHVRMAWVLARWNLGRATAQRINSTPLGEAQEATCEHHSWSPSRVRCRGVNRPHIHEVGVARRAAHFNHLHDDTIDGVWPEEPLSVA